MFMTSSGYFVVNNDDGNVCLCITEDKYTDSHSSIVLPDPVIIVPVMVVSLDVCVGVMIM